MKKTSSACRAGWCDREPLTAAAAAGRRRCRAQLLDVQPPEAAHADGRLRQRLGARPPPWRVGGPAPPAILLAFYRPYWFTTAECTAFPWPFTAAHCRPSWRSCPSPRAVNDRLGSDNVELRGEILGRRLRNRNGSFREETPHHTECDQRLSHGDGGSSRFARRPGRVRRGRLGRWTMRLLRSCTGSSTGSSSAIPRACCSRQLAVSVAAGRVGGGLWVGGVGEGGVGVGVLVGGVLGGP